MFETVITQFILWFPSILFGGLFAYSFWREPRQFRNALFLLLFILTTASLLLARYGQDWMILPIALIILASPFASVIALIANGIIVIRRNGLSASSALPITLALFIIGMFAVFPFAAFLGAPSWFISLMTLFILEGLWFSFTLLALLVYSFLYRLLPIRRTYDFIIIHGAGLNGTEPSPVLAGRIDKALELWERQGCDGMFVASGGQGADEEISEAEAMARYLIRRGVPEDRIIHEDNSTTTRENLEYSKALMDERMAGKSYRAAVVSSDYHVFRCAEYAKDLGIAADGVGSHTRSWLWPAAFIREFAAITRAHAWPYRAILILWAIPNALALLMWLLGIA